MKTGLLRRTRLPAQSSNPTPSPPRLPWPRFPVYYSVSGPQMAADAASVPLPSARLLCELCRERKPALRRPKTGQKVCQLCFFHVFEEEIANTVADAKLFRPGEHVAIGASGGKDSTVLAHVMSTLNKRHGWGVAFTLLSIDEGISGYRDDSLETVKRNAVQYDLPLKIVPYADLYDGWTMDAVVAQIGKRNNCTYCGVFRRQALDRGAQMLGITHVVTGHNADDLAETVLMNILRGDTSRLDRCTEIVTQSADSPVKRSKPLKYAYEKEIVLYAHYKKLDYFSTECIYSPEAFRGTARALIKNLETVRPSAIIDIIHSGESFSLLRGTGKSRARETKAGSCERCGYISSNKFCKACVLLEGLNAGRPAVQIQEHPLPPADKRESAAFRRQLEHLSF
ncbi:uncharacterized protein V1518DRAFT_414126 [Limtongia smithiae]|uniref:uncharacterized protein n=1 Tax=Limtongia smithiae TaxID=1125753 RepID=UPI0034CD50AF